MYAVIDLGSNSFHLLIAEYTGRHFSLVDRCSKKIQLADGLGRDGNLSRAAMERGLECLRLFKEMLVGHPIEQLHVVATQALRQAENSREFLSMAEALGFEVEVIPGVREAELIFRGICDPLPDCASNRLVIDIGGASTEIALGNGPDILFAESLPMGCVSWRDRFFAHAIDYGRRGEAAKEAALAALTPFLERLGNLEWAETYASSGSAKMLSRIALANQWTDGNIQKSSIRNIEEALDRIQNPSDIQLKGLKKERQDLLAPGISIMAALMEALGIEAVFYSPTALREGILGEIAQRRVYFDKEPAKARAIQA